MAANAVSGLIARAYEDRFALSVPQWRLICVLAEDGGKTQREIVDRTVMDKVTVSRAARGLSARRLIGRKAKDESRSDPVAIISVRRGSAGVRAGIRPAAEFRGPAGSPPGLGVRSFVCGRAETCGK